MPAVSVENFTTPQAAQLLGITSAQFRRLVNKRGLAPTDTYTNPHYRSGPDCPLWTAKDIGRLKRTNDLKAILTRSPPDPANAREKRRRRFVAKYSTIEPLLVDACTTLLNLNRYAKWPNCTKANKEEIYSLKNDLVELLYKSGLSDRVYLHKQMLPPKQCFRCDGSGQNWNGEECERCYGTGNFRDELELVFVVFSFLIGDENTRFTWHQPQELVTWTFSETHAPDAWETAPLKAIEMKRSRFAEGKELIRFAIERLRGG